MSGLEGVVHTNCEQIGGATDSGSYASNGSSSIVKLEVGVTSVSRSTLRQAVGVSDAVRLGIVVGRHLVVQSRITSANLTSANPTDHQS